MPLTSFLVLLATSSLLSTPICNQATVPLRGLIQKSTLIVVGKVESFTPIDGAMGRVRIAICKVVLGAAEDNEVVVVGVTSSDGGVYHLPRITVGEKAIAFLKTTPSGSSAPFDVPYQLVSTAGIKLLAPDAMSEYVSSIMMLTTATTDSLAMDGESRDRLLINALLDMVEVASTRHDGLHDLAFRWHPSDERATQFDWILEVDDLNRLRSLLMRIGDDDRSAYLLGRILVKSRSAAGNDLASCMADYLLHRSGGLTGYSGSLVEFVARETNDASLLENARALQRVDTIDDVEAGLEAFDKCISRLEALQSESIVHDEVPR